MKTIKLLSLMIFSMFLISSASALIVVGGMWEDESQSITIAQGTSVEFDVYFTAFEGDAPMDVKVELYKIIGEDESLVKTYIDDYTESEFFENTYAVEDTLSLGEYEVRISGADNDNDSDEYILYLTVREKDTTKPVIKILSPTDGNTYANHITKLHYNIVEENPKVCEYSINGGETKTEFECVTGEDAYIDLTSVEGSNTWTIYVTDIDGNFEEASVTFTVNLQAEDTTAPEITIVSPENKEYDTDTITFKVITNEAAEVWFGLDGEEKTMNNTVDNIFEYEITLDDGEYEVIFHAKDTAGNVNDKTIKFSIDTTEDEGGDSGTTVGDSDPYSGLSDEDKEYLNQFENELIQLGEELDKVSEDSKTPGSFWLWTFIIIDILAIILIVLLILSKR